MSVAIFNRIPKTGSSSLSAYLENAFERLALNGKGVNCHGFPHQSTLRFLQDLGSVIKNPPSYLIGHMPLGIPEEYLSSHGIEAKTILFLRDPASRMRSHLAYLFQGGGIAYSSGEFFHSQYPWISLDMLLRDFQFKWLTSFFSGVNDAMGSGSFWLVDRTVRMQAIRFDYAATLEALDDGIDCFFAKQTYGKCLLVSLEKIEDVIASYLISAFESLSLSRVKEVVRDVCSLRHNATDANAIGYVDWLVDSNFRPGAIKVSFGDGLVANDWINKPELEAQFAELCLDLISNPGFADMALWDLAIQENPSKVSIFNWRVASNLRF